MAHQCRADADGVLRERGWLLDLEVLATLRHLGARCVEEPIDWEGLGESKVRFGLDAARMGFGLWSLRRRLAAWKRLVASRSDLVTSRGALTCEPNR
jgi:hypothetical protein